MFLQPFYFSHAELWLVESTQNRSEKELSLNLFLPKLADSERI